MVIFGSYDENLYALYKETGKRAWVAPQADWVGSSPALAQELGIIFVGLEFVLLNKHGGITAVNALTGKTIWADTTHPALTQASPLYIKKHQQVAIDSNDGKSVYITQKMERLSGNLPPTADKAMILNEIKAMGPETSRNVLFTTESEITLSLAQ